MLKRLLQSSRSYRRFDGSHRLEEATLRELVDLTRLIPSAANRQPLKYVLSADPETNAIIFPCLAWAGYLRDWDGPEEHEQPTGYILLLLDHRISTNPHCDHGIAAQTIMLGAAEKGLGGCIIASIQRERLQRELDIPQNYEILLALALGKPAERVVLQDVESDGDIRYWRDDEDVHHVPKRKLEDILIQTNDEKGGSG